MKNILLTETAGFIGSNFDTSLYIKGDICNRELVEFIFNEYDINGVIHFAAESHVDNSIKNPGVFIETNVNGTFTLLDVAYKHWMEKPFTYKKKYLRCAALAAPYNIIHFKLLKKSSKIKQIQSLN